MQPGPLFLAQSGRSPATATGATEKQGLRAPAGSEALYGRTAVHRKVHPQTVTAKRLVVHWERRLRSSKTQLQHLYPVLGDHPGSQ